MTFENKRLQAIWDGWSEDERMLTDDAHTDSNFPSLEEFILNNFYEDGFDLSIVDDLPIELNGDNDQPTTCSKCGARTYFIELNQKEHYHRCFECDYKFILEFDEEA
jgi:formylmethanofuran dehydrogenase subunit E